MRLEIKASWILLIPFVTSQYFSISDASSLTPRGLPDGLSNSLRLVRALSAKTPTTSTKELLSGRFLQPKPIKQKTKRRRRKHKSPRNGKSDLPPIPPRVMKLNEHPDQVKAYEIPVPKLPLEITRVSRNSNYPILPMVAPRPSPSPPTQKLQKWVGILPQNKRGGNSVPLPPKMEKRMGIISPPTKEKEKRKEKKNSSKKTKKSAPPKILKMGGIETETSVAKKEPSFVEKFLTYSSGRTLLLAPIMAAAPMMIAETMAIGGVGMAAPAFILLPLLLLPIALLAFVIFI